MAATPRASRAAGPSLIGVGSAAVEFQVEHRPHADGPPGGAGRAQAAAVHRRRRPGSSAQYIQELGGGPQLPDRASDLARRRRRRPRRRAVPGQLLVLPRASAAAAARSPPASTRRAWSDATDRQIYAAMLTGPQNMPVFGDNQLTPEEKRDIIAYVQNLQGRPGPGRLGHRAGYGPVHRGSGDLPGRHGGAGLHDAVDCGEVMTVDTGPRPRRRQLEPVDVDDPTLTRFDLVREGARRDGVEIVHYEPQFPVRAPRPRSGSTRIDRAAVPAHRPVRARRSWSLYIWWPWEYELGARARAKLYTPLLGLTLGLARCSLLGFGDPHLGQEAAAARRSRSRTATTAVAATTSSRSPAQTMVYMVDETRHPAPAAAQGGDRCCRPGAARRWSRPAPLIGGADQEPAQGRPAVLFHDRVGPGAQRRQAGPADPRGRHPDPARGRQRRRPDDGVPGHPGRRDQRVRRLADAADPPARGGRRGGPGQQRARRRQVGHRRERLHVRQLRRVLEDLHPRRLPGEPVRAADQPAALPVPPVAVPHHRQRQADLRPGQPAACPCCRSRWTRRASSWQSRTTRRPSARPSGSGHEAPQSST